jgi:type IV pilus assembly protein PilY1
MSRIKTRRLAGSLGSLVLTLASAAATADDTEIFFNQANSGVNANVLMILDTSGSMNDLVSTTEPYDPAKTYTADKCSGSSFDKDYYYYGSKVPSCTSTSKLRVTQFKCAAMGDLAAAQSGFRSGSFIQWGSSSNAVKTGSGSKKKTTTTTTYGWGNTLSPTNTTGLIECKDDAGKSGDGVDKTKPYASTDTYSIVVVTDNSGNVVSTTGTVTGGQLTGVWDAAKNYFAAGSGATTTLYSANYLNYYYDSTQTTSRSKMSIMQTAATSLLNSVGGINVGVMRYNYGGAGGMVLSSMGDIATKKTSLATLINSWAPQGNTPLSETYYESYLYYSGQGVRFGNSSKSTTCTSTDSSNGKCLGFKSFDQPSVAPSRSPATASGANYASPAKYSCQKNYIVYLTDGLPNESDTANSDIQKLGVTCDSSSVPGAKGGLCTAALAGYMNNNDVNGAVEGKQNVTSYFIGFGNDFGSAGAPTAAFSYLDKAAQAGGGKAYTATSLTELSAAFNEIFTDVLKTNTMFSAPAVAVNAFNRTQTLNDLYVSVFSPKVTYHWPGNVKRYKVVDGQIVDKNGDKAVDAGTGFFKESATSYWSASKDGMDVALGGAANMIPDQASRTVYIYKGTNPTAPAAMTALSDTTVTDADLGIGGAGDPELADLVEWALGTETVKDVNGNPVKRNRHSMGDPVHAQPTVVIYGKATSGGGDDTVVYIPTNDGYFHAIDAATGVELWSFVPQEMLPSLKYLYLDDTASKKHYGLDGPISVLKYDINGDGTIDSEAGDRVILYFGTGRNADTSTYYALDVTKKASPKFMWSINASTLPGLGQSWSAPMITRVDIKDGQQNSQKLALVISGGYDASEDNYDYQAADGVGNHLYIVDAISGNRLWAAGTTTGTDINFGADRMTHSIPSAPTVLDTDADGYADRIYVGDMAGQVWRFDIWKGLTVDKLVTGGVIASLGAKDEKTRTPANTRRFYSPPDVAAVSRPGIPTYLNVAIGSGYRGHPLQTTTDDRFYALRDHSPFTKLTAEEYKALPIIVDKDAVTSLSSPAPSVLVDITATVTPTVPPDSAGWELKLNRHGGGEKVLAASRTFDGMIIFPSYQPNTGTGATNPCTGVGTGTNRSYVVSMYDGAPVIVKNKETGPTVDDRDSDLSQGGIAPEAVFLFPGKDKGGSGDSGGNDGSGSGKLVCLHGAEVLDVCKDFDQRVKTYWRDRSSLN